MPTLEEQIAALNESLNAQQAPVLPTLPRGSPDDGTSPGLLGRIGSVLAGGQSPIYRLRGREEDAAGSRALLNFGLNMLQASGPARVRPDLGSVFASGIQGAQQSMDLDQRRAAAVAQQDYQQRMDLAKLGVEQNRDRIERMKAGLSLLQLQNRPVINADGSVSTAGTGGGGAGGGAGTAARQFTGDLEKDRQLIKGWESGGDPTALNYVAKADPSARARGATASGLYGFVDSTWQEGLKMIGGDPAKYPTAASAPTAVQDDVFTAVYKARSTAPWDPSKWGQNWVKNASGGYDLVKTGATGSSASTPPPYKVATTGTTPPPPTGAPAATPAVAGAPGATPPAAPGTTPPAPVAAPPTTGPLAGLPKIDDFVAQNIAKPTPEEEASWRTPMNPEEEKNLRDGMKRLQSSVDAARASYNAAGSKDSESAYHGAQKAYSDAEAALAQKQREALKVGDDRKAKWYEGERGRLKELYGKLLEGSTAETKAQADHTRALALKEAEQEGQFVTDQKKKFGDSQQGAYDQVDSLQTLRQLSDAIPGQATLSPDVRNFLVRFGFTPEGLNSESARVQAFESALARTVIELRKGVQMGQLSDRDLSFIQNMGPQAMQNPETRAAILGHLVTAANRKAQYIERVNELYGGGASAGGMAWSKAVAQARKEIPEFVVPTVPKELMPGYRLPGRDPSIPGPAADNAKARQAWIRDNVPKGGLVRLPDGTMRPVSLGE